MKAPLSLVLLVLSATLAFASPEAPPPSDLVGVSRWLSDLGPRREGSAQEERVFETLLRWFSGRVDVRASGFLDEEGEHSFSSRVWFRVPGPRPGELLVVVPTDGSNDVGLAWAVAWAEDTLTSGTPVSVTYLFTGAERGSGSSRGLGSRAFLQDFYPTVPAAVLYLDTAARSPEVRLTTESGSSPSPLWMVQGMTEALTDEGLAPRFTGTAPSLFRLDMPEKQNALAPWFARSIPGLLVGSGPADQAVVRALEQFAASLTQGVPSTWDRHYLVFDFGSWKVFWGQGTYLTLFLGVAAFLLFGYAALGRSRRGSLRVLTNGLWQLPVFLAFAFLALVTGTLLASALQASRGTPELWRQAPFLVWAFKAMVAVSLYLILFLPFRRSPLSRNPDFYNQAALVTLGVMTMAAAAFELSFSFYFLWALVWAAVQVILPWRPAKLLALVLGPLWLFKAAYDVLGPQADLELTRWALDSPLAGNLILAGLFFPFLLQVNAWHFSGHRHQDRNEALWAGLQLGLWTLATVVLGLVVLRYQPAALPAPRQSVERIDLDQTPRPDLWETALDRSAFLDRTVWTLKFTGPLAVEDLSFELEAQVPILIFDSSFPVAVDPESHRARVIIGRQPPLPLEVRLTLPNQIRTKVKIEATLSGDRPYRITDTIELNP